MNSIRESCRSIEELDLGGNKLTDLIEVYKILQCTPNLRFLNLSENDLSRTSPVAMASSSCPTSSSSISGTGLNASSMTISSSLSSANTGLQLSQWATSLNQRTCLAPINQNHQHQHQTIGTRRHHSTLGQSTGSSSSPTATTSTNTNTTNSRCPANSTAPVHFRTRQTTSRVAEARRLAAANALAQSKKTSSMVASKLASSAAAGGPLARHQASGSIRSLAVRDSDSSSTSKQSINRLSSAHHPRHQTNNTSTMCLARSLSSLSAKDVRTSSSSLGRLTAHRSSVRKESATNQRDRRASIGVVKQPDVGESEVVVNAGQFQKQQIVSKSTTSSKLTTSSSHQKLFVEPIVETEDVDMGAEQQLSPSGQTSSNNNQSVGHHHNNQAAMVATSKVSSSTLQTGSNSLVSNVTRSTSNSTGNQQGGSSVLSPNATSANFRRTFESIKALALNNTGCQWRVVCSILSRMPNLEELHLSLNNYERIDLDPNEFKHNSLKRLYLCNNPKLTNWEELDKLLIAFPSLEALSIADCNISQIPDNLDRAREWRKLCGLNINGWPIKEWPVVERLNQLPSLIDLKCRNLEVLNTIDEPRHHLIARLPKLQRLNGSEIEEREDAEKAFLRFFMANSHLERPSRFHELIQIHGEVTPVDVDVDLSPPSQAHVRVIYLNRNFYRKENEDILMSEDFLIKLMDNIDSSNNVHTGDGANSNNNSSQENMDVGDVVPQSGAAASSSNNDNEAEMSDTNKPLRLFKDDSQEVIAIDVDLRQSVRKFKSTIASIFGLESQNLILYYIDHEMVGLMGPELIKHNQKKLWNYNVQDGDQFIVEER